ncbi:MAG: hypothetical protein ACJA1P_001570, partial [Maribacter sp.]
GVAKYDTDKRKNSSTENRQNNEFNTADYTK